MYIQEALAGIQPLDLIFFRGHDFISRLVLRAEAHLGCDRFSHVGLVVTSEILPNIPELESGKLYLWESTSTDKRDPVTDVEDGKRHFGVQIRPLEDAVKVYSEGGEVTWGRLRNNPWTDITRRNEIRKVLSDIHEQFGRRTYEANVLSLLAVVFPWLRKARDAVDTVIIDGYKLFRSWSSTLIGPPDVPVAGWLFCSELIAIVYQNLNVLDKGQDVRNMAPADFLGVRNPYPNVTSELIPLEFPKGM